MARGKRHIENDSPQPLPHSLTRAVSLHCLICCRISWTDMRLRQFSLGVSLLLAVTSVSAYGKSNLNTLEYMFGDRVEVSCLNRSMSDFPLSGPFHGFHELIKHHAVRRANTSKTRKPVLSNMFLSPHAMRQISRYHSTSTETRRKRRGLIVQFRSYRMKCSIC